MIDWLAIRNEYINTNISYRKLAEKHKISFSTLEKKARVENWKDERDKQGDNIATKVRQKTADKIVNNEVNRIDKILNTTDTAHEKVVQALDQLTLHIDMFGKSHNTDKINVGDLRKLVATLKDIKDVVGVKDDKGAEDIVRIVADVERDKD